MIALTGATGQLGRLVLTQLLAKVPAASVVAVVRTPAKAADFAARGVVVREAGYADLAALERAFAGVEQLLLISSSELGQRGTQHRNVIAAAQGAGVKLLVYTSLLHADTSPLSLAPEHIETEQALKASGIPYIILRNGWYTENHTGSLGGSVAHGAILGSAAQGRFSAAARADFAAAAVAALTGKAKVNHTYELAGDESYTLADLAAEVSRQAGKPVAYHNLPEAEYSAALKKFGLPDFFADAIASWDVAASRDVLREENGELRALIGRPTTPLAETVKQALAG